VTPQLSELLRLARAACLATYAAGSVPDGENYALMAVDHLYEKVLEIDPRPIVAVSECEEGGVVVSH
jgi:hypothetical protein